MSVFNRSDDDGFGRGARAVVALADRAAGNARGVEARLEEAAGLAAAIGIDVVERLSFRLREAKPGTLFGQGQVQQIADAVVQSEAVLVVVDAALTPAQQKNLEDATKAKVIDRTGLILEIFGERAATAEGRLQVELAHLDYQAGRLVRSWTHLERQRGGFGFLGGPGETQIEADRRQIRDRMAKLRRELEQVRKTRGLHRARRRRAPWPVIALVGYTNAGKSTLFNRMTGATVMAENLLFATLDPTMRQIGLPGLDKAILSDTVGFVSDLPMQLVAAFRATLEEVTAADIIIHVRDMAHPDREAQRADVLAVLAGIGVGPDAPPPPAKGKRRADDADDDAPLDLAPVPTPILEAWNKLDALDDEEAARLTAEAARHDDVVTLSALTGQGVDDLRRLVAARLATGHRLHSIDVPLADGAAQAWLHQHGEVIAQAAEADMMVIVVRLSEGDWARFQAR